MNILDKIERAVFGASAQEVVEMRVKLAAQQYEKWLEVAPSFSDHPRYNPAFGSMPTEDYCDICGALLTRSDRCDTCED